MTAKEFLIATPSDTGEITFYDKQKIEDCYNVNYDDFLILRDLFSHYLDAEGAESAVRILCARLSCLSFEEDVPEYEKYRKELEKIKTISKVDCLKYIKDKGINLVLTELASRWNSLQDKDKTFICETLIGRFKSKLLMQVINELSNL